MSLVLKRITDKLEELGIEYEHKEHEPVITSQDAAKLRDSDISIGAKALVFLADKEPVIVVVPGNKKLDLQRFKKLYNIKDMSMANEEQLLKVTGLTRGAVPPMGSVFDTKSYFSDDFREKDLIAFNAGSHTHSIFMKARDLIDIEKPIIGDFSK
jgi:Ala-tRNA(Pro) deacylase